MADLLYEDQGRELDWDDEIEDEGNPFRVLPEGDYRFIVKGYERGRFPGSAKIPECNKAVVTLQVTGAGGSGEFKEDFIMHTKMEWKLSAFYVAIGLKKHGEKLRMQWNNIIGKQGYCSVEIHRWENQVTHKKYENNRVEAFFDPEEWEKHGFPPIQQPYRAPAIPAPVSAPAPAATAPAQTQIGNWRSNAGTYNWG
jgi:hypothetical protein